MMLLCFWNDALRVLFWRSVWFPFSASCIIASDFCWNTISVPTWTSCSEQSSVKACVDGCECYHLCVCSTSCTRCQLAGRSALLYSTQLAISKLCYILLPLWNIVLNKYSSSTFWEIRLRYMIWEYWHNSLVSVQLVVKCEATVSS